MTSHEKTLSSILREAKHAEPLVSAEDAQKLISTQRIVHKADAMRAPWRKPLVIAGTAVISAILGALAVALFAGHRVPVLPFSPGADTRAGAATMSAQAAGDSASYSRIGKMFYRYFSYDTLFERKLRALPFGIAGNAEMATRFVELTPTELARIGVRVEEGSTELYKVCSYAPALAERYIIGPKHINFPDMEKIDEYPEVVVPDFEPLLISDDRGMWRRIVVQREAIDPELIHEYDQASVEDNEVRHAYLIMEMSRQSEEKLRRRINTLIPVIVRTGRSYTEADRRDRKFRPDVILWYEPTAEFLAHLPERIASQLRVELAASELLTAANRVNPDLTVSVQRRPDLRGGEHDVQVREELASGAISGYVDRVVGGDKYLDVWRTSAGAIQGSYLYPNPAPEGRTVLRYKLLESRIVSITLFDIWGRRIKELVSPEARTAGEGEFALGCGELPEGMYVVVLQTDRGEQAIQRLMIE